MNSRRRQVTFFSRVSTYEIPSRHDMTQQEISWLWFDTSSSVSILGNRTETIALIDAGFLTEDDEDYCRRGLFTRKEARRRFELMNDSREMVFRVQAIQLKEGYFDAEEIAFSYFKTTCESLLEARIQGNKDQLESQNEPFFAECGERCTSHHGDLRKYTWGRQSSLTDAVSESPNRVRLLLIQRS